jgi:hypothetical protein
MGQHRFLAIILQRSVSCYVNALVRRQHLDKENSALWSYAGSLYDEVDISNISVLPTLTNISRESRRWKEQALEHESSLAADSIKYGSAEVIALRVEIALKYRAALAHAATALARCTLTDTRPNGDDSSTAQACADFADYLVQTLQHAQRAAECDRSDLQDLKALWSLCAGYMRSAGQAAFLRNEAEEKAVEGCGICLRDLAEKLDSALRLLNSTSVTAQSAELNDVEQVLSVVLQQINESPLVSDPTSAAAQDFDTGFLEEMINDATFALERLSSRASDETIAVGFAATADKVNVNQSPAHPHIQQCWLNAAEQMRLAVVATAQEEYELYKLRSSLHVKLALGPFATVAGYFAKADRARTAQAEELWREAGKLLLKAAELLGDYCFRLKHLRDAHAAQYRGEAAVLERRACRVAKTADWYERVSTQQSTSGTAGQLGRLYAAELQLRLAMPEGGTLAPVAIASVLPFLKQLQEDLFQSGRPTNSIPRMKQILCVRHAVEVCLFGRSEQCLVWCAAATFATSDWVRRDIYNRLVRRAWELRGVDTPCDPALLISPGKQTAAVDLHYITQIEAAGEALVESQRQVELSEEPHLSAVRSTRREADRQFRTCANSIASGLGLLGGPYGNYGEAVRNLEKGARARQAGLWSVAAAQAAGASRYNASYSFQQAASCASYDVAGEQRNSATLKAGERFASAAEAELAGNMELSDLWLKAAEATATAIYRSGGDDTAQSHAKAAEQLETAISEARTASERAGHVARVAELAGGKQKWEEEEREITVS